MRAALYCRVSSTQQAKEGDSIPAQLDALNKYAIAQTKRGSRFAAPSCMSLFQSESSSASETAEASKASVESTSRSSAHHLVGDGVCRHPVDDDGSAAVLG